MNRESFGTARRVLHALRRVNLQGNVFGQSVALRLGLSESDVEALEVLLDAGAATAGRLSELMGLSTGATTRVVDRLEQAGYVRRSADPADRRRVVVELVPDKIARVQGLLGRMDAASAKVLERYSEEQLDLIDDFLTRMTDVTRSEASSLREALGAGGDADAGASEHAARLAGVTVARLVLKSGVESLALDGGAAAGSLYEARFEGDVPKVRVRGGIVTVHYRGTGLPWDWRKRKAALGLATAPRWDIDLVGGIRHVRADLTALDVGSASLTGGSEQVRISLGRPTGRVKVRIVGGINQLHVDRPADVPIQLSVMGGTGGIDFDGLAHGATGMASLKSPGADRAKDRFEVEVKGGSSRISISGRGPADAPLAKA